MSAGLGRDLILRILAFQQQVQRYGDLDRASRQTLAELFSGRNSAVIKPIDEEPKQREGAYTQSSRSRLLRPGTLLTREHGGVLHRVIVMEDGFGWNGRTYDSLSIVAFAITGTRWSGPRFFGLRNRLNPKAPACSSPAGKTSTRSPAAVPLEPSLP